MPPKIIPDQSSGISPVVILGIVFFIFFVLGGGYWYTNVYNKTPEPTQTVYVTPSTAVGTSSAGVPSAGAPEVVSVVVPPAGAVIPKCKVTEELVNGKCLIICADGTERIGEQCLIKCADGKIRVGIGCNDDPNAKPARLFPIPPEGAYEFGGMYGYGNPTYGNPLADNKLGCPSTEYTSNKILDFSGVDNQLYYCAKKIKDRNTWKPTKGSAEFGGMFTGNGVYKNPFAKSDKTGEECPDGFSKSQVLGTENIDHGLHFCYKTINDPDTWMPDPLVKLEFGGMYGSNPGLTTNIASGGPSCPTGFAKTTLYSTVGVGNFPGDYEFTYCTDPR